MVDRPTDVAVRSRGTHGVGKAPPREPLLSGSIAGEYLSMIFGLMAIAGLLCSLTLIDSHLPIAIGSILGNAWVVLRLWALGIKSRYSLPVTSGLILVCIFLVWDNSREVTGPSGMVSPVLAITVTLLVLLWMAEVIDCAERFRMTRVRK